MAYPHPRVLSIGSYPTAFESRNRILELAGFDVVPCFRGSGAAAKLASKSFDCVVIGDGCISFQLELIREFRRVNPSVPIIVVHPLPECSLELEVADATIDSLAGPEALLRLLSSMMRKAPQFAVGPKVRASAARK